jgi:acyl-CoA thioester hydrolase
VSHPCFLLVLGEEILVTRPLLIERPIVVRTYDIDYANIAHNIVYFRWLEDLRAEILAGVLPIDEIVATGISPILTRTEIDYRWPVRLGDAATGRMWVADLSRTRWTLAAEIVVGEQVCAAARQSGYFADLKSLRAVRVPEQLRERWQAEAGAIRHELS